VNGGGYYNVAARLLEDKVRVAEEYAHLLKADLLASVRAVAAEGKVPIGDLHQMSVLKLKTAV
jgi:hypothetical protein